MPVEKPAPPRPRRFDFFTSSTMAAGVKVRAFLKPCQPPRCWYTDNVCEPATPKFLVTILMPLASCQPIRAPSCSLFPLDLLRLPRVVALAQVIQDHVDLRRR